MKEPMPGERTAAEHGRGNWWVMTVSGLVLGALVGLAVAYVVMIGVDQVYVSPRCDDPDCLDGLVAMVLGILAGALAWIATVVAFAVGFRLGSLVPVGTAIAVGLLLAGGVWQLGPAHGRFLILLSLLELILAIAAGRAVSR